MTKPDTPDPTAAPGAPEPARIFAEEFGVVGERVGMPRMVARLLGWMLICDPPQQSTLELARALSVSRASISIATRLLEASGLLRRAALPGARGHVYELDDQIFAGRMDAAGPFGTLRRVMQRGIELIGDEDSPRAARLREGRDFYAFVEREIPLAIDRYRAQRSQERRVEP